jgi:hypothetical protein
LMNGHAGKGLLESDRQVRFYSLPDTNPPSFLYF